MDPFLQAAIEEAKLGLAEGGIIGRGHNRRVQRGSAILHGEMDAFENAGRHSQTGKSTLCCCRAWCRESSDTGA